MVTAVKRLFFTPCPRPFRLGAPLAEEVPSCAFGCGCQGYRRPIPGWVVRSGGARGVGVWPEKAELAAIIGETKGEIGMRHRIVHFEIPVSDIERGKEFYGKLFGWTFEDFGGDYVVVSTGPAEEGCVGGGLSMRQKAEEVAHNYILVESVEEHSKKVEELGGRIVVPKRPVKGMGWFAIALDTDGNVFGLWEVDESVA
jgi:predicted enzyme related to lactoylglutathione lyase